MFSNETYSYGFRTNFIPIITFWMSAGINARVINSKKKSWTWFRIDQKLAIVKSPTKADVQLQTSINATSPWEVVFTFFDIFESLFVLTEVLFDVLETLLQSGHPTWWMDTLLDGWIFYFHELFICLIFSLLKVIPAISDLYIFNCLTIIICNFFRKRRRLLCILKYNQRFFMNLFRTKRILSWIRYQYGPTIKDFTIVVVGFSKTNSKF